MEKLKFHKEEVISFLEDKISMNTATQDELEMYENFQWSGKLNKTNYTYKIVLKQMRELFEQSF
jgi:hypothetical protein